MDPEIEQIKRDIAGIRNSINAFRELHNDHEKRIGLLESRIRVTIDLIQNTLKKMESRFSELTKKTNEEISLFNEFSGTLNIILLKLSILELDYDDRKNSKTFTGENTTQSANELLPGNLIVPEKDLRRDLKREE